MTEFIARLKQRKLVQWALAYVAFAFALLQGVDVVAHQFGWPDGLQRGITLVLIIGFVVALVLAWYHGERGAQRVSSTEIVILALLLAIGGGLLWRFERAVPSTGSSKVQVSTPAPVVQAAFDPPKDSLVVLPFQNLSGDPAQRYFSDGITEELTDALGQNPALRVIAWDTAAKYRDNAQSATDIGKQLNVANLLHGSIAHEGDAVRVTVELVNARTGYQLWSAHYDESFKDIFKVQDAVSKAIADALQIKLAQADLPHGGTRNPEAHDWVLKGRAFYEKYDAANLDAARKDFEQAIALDPDYADAHALLSHTLIRLVETSDLPLKDALPRIRAEAEKALALDPRNADGWLSLGLAEMSFDPPQIAEARAASRKALTLDPNNVDAHVDYGLMLPIREGLAQYQEAARLDPDSAIAQDDLIYQYLSLGEWAHMMAAAEDMLRLNPGLVDSAFFLAYGRQQLHQYDQMEEAFDHVNPATPLARQLVDTGRLVYRSVANPALRPQALAALAGLRQHQSNKDVASNLVVMYASIGENAELLRLLESMCPTDPLFCTDLTIDGLYAPLRGDPRFRQLAARYATAPFESEPVSGSSGAAHE